MTRAAWKMRQLRKARQSKRFVESQAARKMQRPIVTKAQFIEALRGTGGILSAIAGKLGVCRRTVWNLLQRPGWEVVQEELDSEREVCKDEAERTILYAIGQRMDLTTAANTARWYLSKMRRENFGDDKEIKISGGKDPIRHLHMNIPIESLQLPLDVRRQILEALDDKEEIDKQGLLEQRVG